MKTIEFLKEEAQHFELLYESLLSAPSIKATEARMYAKICEKFEAIGTYIKDSPLMTLQQTILPALTVGLEDAEHLLLKKILDSVEYSAAGARLAAKTFDWLESKVK